jgi:hypothetical protein
VLHDSAMWVFGGMTDLQDRADFWKFDFSKLITLFVTTWWYEDTVCYMQDRLISWELLKL